MYSSETGFDGISPGDITNTIKTAWVDVCTIFLNKPALKSGKRFPLDILSDSLHWGLPQSRGTAANAQHQQPGPIWEIVYWLNV